MKCKVRLSSSLILVGLLGSLASCSGMWNRLNQRGLESDLISLLGSVGLENLDPACQMVGTTRNGYCLLALKPVEQQRVISGLELRPITSLEDPGMLEILEQGCRTSSFITKDGLPRYYAGGRPAALRLSSGTAFEFALLTVVPGEDRVCIDLGYAYG